MNGAPRATVDRAAPDEPLDRYLERTLRQAQILVLPNRSTSYRLAKRALDLFGAVVLLILAAPVCWGR